MRPTNLVIFFIMLGLTIYSFLYLLIQIDTKYFIFDIQFYLLLASIVYLGFLIFYEFKTQGKIGENYIGLASDERKNFMTTQFSKFLFSIYFAVFFIFICTRFLATNFHFFDGKSFFFSLVEIHMNIILPVYMFLELFILVEHTRSPKYTWDLLILCIIFLIRWIIGLILRSIFINNYTLSDGISELGEVLLSLLISFNGFFFYDFVLFKKDNPNGVYTVMIQN